MLQNQQFSWDKRFAGRAGIAAQEDTPKLQDMHRNPVRHPHAGLKKNARDLRAGSFPVWITPQKRPVFFKTGTAPDRDSKRI